MRVTVADHHIFDFADGGRGVVPGLVAEMGVGRHRIDLNAHALQRGILVLQIFQFGRADKGEVRRIEEEHRPLALGCRVADFQKLAGLKSLRGEGFNRAANERHRHFLL